jgi:ribosomal-protein-serine acetyltransferase
MFATELTAGAVLAPLRPWQASEFLAHLDRAREHITPWVGSSFVKAVDLPSAKAVLQSYADAEAKDGGGIFGVWLAGTLVGGVMFVSFDAEAATCEVGCWLEPGAEGRGLIIRATRVIIDWAVRERGIHRVEWCATAGNERSVSVARRLGMTREGVLREAAPPRAGETARRDLEIWALLAGEWQSPAGEDEQAIDALVAAFFGAFTNSGGRIPALETVRDVFLPEGLIIKAGADCAIYTVDSFITPRRALLTSGELTDFQEEETDSTTQVLGDIATRRGRYRKSGILRGTPFTGTGTKVEHFLRTPDGWKMSALSWYDD